MILAVLPLLSMVAPPAFSMPLRVTQLVLPALPTLRLSQAVRDLPVTDLPGMICHLTQMI